MQMYLLYVHLNGLELSEILPFFHSAMELMWPIPSTLRTLTPSLRTPIPYPSLRQESRIEKLLTRTLQTYPQPIMSKSRRVSNVWALKRQLSDCHRRIRAKRREECDLRRLRLPYEETERKLQKIYDDISEERLGEARLEDEIERLEQVNES